MNKIGAVIIVVAVVAVAYILLLLFMPVLVDVVVFQLVGMEYTGV